MNVFPVPCSAKQALPFSFSWNSTAFLCCESSTFHNEDCFIEAAGDADDTFLPFDTTDSFDLERTEDAFVRLDFNGNESPFHAS